jgi:hypothetical protein
MSRRFAERLTTTILFTAAQVWAVVTLLVQFHADAVLAAAVALVMSAALIAVHDAWRDLRAAGRPAERPEVPQEQVRDSDFAGL